MKKQLPGWAVLLIITLIAGLALGGTYALTKDPIEEQKRLTEENARRAVLPSADSFVALDVAPDADVNWAYAGLKDGETVGYVAQNTVKGFGGEVEITVGADANGTLTGVRVGGTNFSETAGLGAKSKEPAFYEQFAGKDYPVDLRKNGGEIDAITGATITSSAVVRGVNSAVKTMSEIAGFQINEPVALVEELGNNRYATTKQGFGGPVYVELEIVDGAIRDIVIGDSSFSESAGYGAGAKEERFYGQYIGKSGAGLVLNADIDQVSGATITSTAVNDAVNMILLYVNDPAAFAAQAASQPEEIDVSIPAGAQTATAQGKGLTGTFDVTVGLDEAGAVNGIQIGDASTTDDAPFLGMVKNNSAFLAQFIGKSGTVNADEIDVVAGATRSSKGVIDAVNAVLNPVQEDAPAANQPEEISVAIPEGAKTATAQGSGLTGVFEVTVGLDEAGAVNGIQIGDASTTDDAPFLGMVKNNSAFLAQFIGKSGAVNSDEIDVVAGATRSSKGVIDAVNAILAPAQEEPTQEPVAEPTNEPEPEVRQPVATEEPEQPVATEAPAPQPEQQPEPAAPEADVNPDERDATSIVWLPMEEKNGEDGVYSGDALAFFTEYRAYLSVLPDNTANMIEIYERPAGTQDWAYSPLTQAFEERPLHLPLPTEQDSPSASAAAIAVNQAYRKYLANEYDALKEAMDDVPLAESWDQDGIGVGTSMVFFDRYTVEAFFSDGKLIDFRSLDYPQKALEELLIGQTMPLDPAQYGAAGDLAAYQVAGIILALNDAYQNSLAGQQ